MDRNRLLYFLVGGLLITTGYVVRVMQVGDRTGRMLWTSYCKADEYCMV